MIAKIALYLIGWFSFVFGFGFFAVSIYELLNGLPDNEITLNFFREVAASIFFAGWWLCIKE